jgi:isochorismate synthase
MTTLAQRFSLTCDPPALRVTVRRVGMTDPFALFAQRRARDAVVWAQPAAQRALAGIGVAAAFRAEGPDRLRLADAWWRALLATADVTAPADAPAAPVGLGGMAFDPGRPPAPHWQPFGAAWFVVPAITVIVERDDAWLVVAHPGTTSEPNALRDHWPADPPLSGRAATTELVADSAPWFRAAVGEAVADIARGRFEKLVLAREVVYRRSSVFEPDAALTRLRATYPSCTIFAVARGASTFLGATPERLVRLDGREIRTMCLAGTAARGVDADDDARRAAALLADGKERREHRFVVTAMRAALAPVCDEIVIPETPTVVSLPNLHHLRTPIRGRLAGDQTILSVVEQLHPSPAVGASPRDAAFPALRHLETFDRGWFAAPLGWLAPNGGEFVVALRSALLTGAEARLFAGCGIVAGSDPDRELAETELKLLPMRAALGVEGA